MSGYGLFIVPLSWAVGKATKNEGKKTIWAFGPFRYFVVRELSPWKE